MRKNVFILTASFFLLIALASCSAKKPSEIVPLPVEKAKISIYPAATHFDGITREMRSAGYWISKIKNPDAEILGRKGINALNARTVKESIFIKDIRYFPAKYPARAEAAKIKKDIDLYARYYDGVAEERVGKEHLSQITDNIDFSVFEKTINVKFAMTVKYAELKGLPSDQPLYSSMDTLDLDRMQLTLLDLGTPMAVLCATKDNQWFYVISEIAEGWIRRDSFAFCRQYDIKKHKQWKNTGVCISASADIYADKDMKKFLESVKMGTNLQFYKIDGSRVEIRMPSANKSGWLEYKKAFADKSGISSGFLKYTGRNVLNQAFKNLNQPYGWGGMNGDADCSSFLKQVFACFGIILPRNSTGQSRTGKASANFDVVQDSDTAKAERIMKQGTPGISILYFPGHIMLYIGSDNNKPYIIHSVRGYTEDYDDVSEVYIINKVAVTSMDIGEASKKGSYLRRASLMRTIK
ncbi:MAG: SH3 domain-containing protein [Endomicrobium sp.]|jgi:hypothetical protein|nr:SH3 domain-containing protein [Endomicrobium sp.]